MIICMLAIVNVFIVNVKAQNITDTTNITVSKNGVLLKNFIGFGAEWDPQFWADFNMKKGASDTDWALIEKRIKWMKLPFVRMMMLTKWVTNGDDKFNWNSPQMVSVCKHLDLCQRNGVDVILTDWGIEKAWNKVKGFTGNDDPRYADAMGKYLDYLINTKKYTCIKYFVFVNEPNYEGGGWDKWKNGLINVSNIIKKYNFNIKLLGPDVSNNYTWYKNSAIQLKDIFDGWDLHTYYKQNIIASNKYEDTVAKYWNLVKNNDGKITGKDFFIGEMGVSDGLRGSSINDSAETFWYGINLVDMATQAVKEGTSAVSAWMLGDETQQNFNNGMWKDKAENFRVKPWFYYWSLLTRNFPAGSDIIMPQTEKSESLKCLAANKGDQWTVCLINQTKEEKHTKIYFSDLSGQKEFEIFKLEKDKLSIDDNQFLLPSNTINVNNNEGQFVSVNPNSVIVITSFK